MVYLASKNLLAFHTKDDRVYVYDAINGTHVHIFDTNLNEHGHSLPEHGIIRTNKTEDDLFVLMAPNRIGVLTKVTKLGFDTLVGVITMDGHNISSYKPFNYDKVLTLCETMMLLVHQISDTSSKVLHYLSLTKAQIHHIETHVFELCSQEKYIAVSAHNNQLGIRDKLFFLELDSTLKPNLVDVMDFSSASDKTPGSIIFDMKMDYYYQDYPILTCLELDGRKRIQVFYMKNGMFNQIDEKDNSYQNVCLMTRTLDRKWWSIDMQGNIYHSVANIPKLKSPKKNQVRSSSPNVKKFSSNVNEASFITRDPGHNYDSIDSGPVSYRNKRFVNNRRKNVQRTPVRVTEVIYE